MNADIESQQRLLERARRSFVRRRNLDAEGSEWKIVRVLNYGIVVSVGRKHGDGAIIVPGGFIFLADEARSRIQILSNFNAVDSSVLSYEKQLELAPGASWALALEPYESAADLHAARAAFAMSLNELDKFRSRFEKPLFRGYFPDLVWLRKRLLEKNVRSSVFQCASKEDLECAFVLPPVRCRLYDVAELLASGSRTWPGYDEMVPVPAFELDE